MLGGGPSLKSVDVDRLRGSRVIAVNNAYKLGDWIDVLFYGDCHWLQPNKHAMQNWPGLKVTVCEGHAGKLDIKVLSRRRAMQGLSTQPGTLTWNLSSGACAINLAFLFGVKRIVLLGFDMRKVDGEPNWHHDYGPRSPNHDPYKRFLRPFPAIAEALKRHHVEVVNATPESALTVFPIVDPETVLPSVKETVWME